MNNPLPEEVETYALVACRDANVLQSLSKKLATFVPGSSVLRLTDENGWERLPDRKIAWAFVDASLLRSGRNLLNSNVRHLVLFNVARFQREVETFRVLPVQHGRTIEQEDFCLTADLVEERYGPQIVRLSTTPPLTEPHRRCAVEDPTNAAIYDPQLIIGPVITDFLGFLQAEIHRDAARLSDTFVDETSSVPVSSWQKIGDLALVKVQEAADNLRQFVRADTSSGVGRFLVAKAGAGKSTLCYKIGQSEDAAGNVLTVAVDYTLVATSEILRSSLDPLLRQARETFKDFYSFPSHGQAGHWIVRLQETLKVAVESGDFESLPSIPDQIRDILVAEPDRGLLTRMYCYYELAGRRPEDVYNDYKDLARLLRDTEAWYRRLQMNAKQLFAKYAYFCLHSRICGSHLRIM